MDCKNLTTVENFSLTGATVLNGVFSGCESLTSVQLPETVEEINGTFSGCVSLTGDLVIPDNVKVIGSSAFKGCTGFDGELKLGEALKSIGAGAFQGCSNITGNLVIPDAVENIGADAFKGCEKLLTGNILKLGKGLKSIGYGAFSADASWNSTYFDKIYCGAPIPPSIDIDYSFYGGVLIVPKGCLNTYLDSKWTSVVGAMNDVPNIIEEDF